MNIPSKITLEMRSTLEDVFENPFVPGSRHWHSYQRLLNNAAESILSINHRTNCEIDYARTRGIVAQLERDLKRIGPTRQEVEAA
jgi:hypothetical protein